MWLYAIFYRFSTLLDIDKLTLKNNPYIKTISFSTLLDIDKLTPMICWHSAISCFSTLLDIDKLTPASFCGHLVCVLVLCWILINLHFAAVNANGQAF